MDHKNFNNTVQRKMLPYFIQKDTQGTKGWNIYNRDYEQIGTASVEINEQTLRALKKYARLDQKDTLYLYGDSSQPFDGLDPNLDYFTILGLISKCTFLQNKEGK